MVRGAVRNGEWVEEPHTSLVFSSGTATMTGRASCCGKKRRGKVGQWVSGSVSTTYTKGTGRRGGVGGEVSTTYTLRAYYE